jgi:hypothetical protein
MEVSNQLHASTALAAEKSAGSHRTAVWEGFRDDLDVSEKKICFPCWE